MDLHAEFLKMKREASRRRRTQNLLDVLLVLVSIGIYLLLSHADADIDRLQAAQAAYNYPVIIH